LRKHAPDSGQSLVELVLVAPLFLIFMAGIPTAAGLFLDRMELTALCRELPLVISRQSENSGAPSDKQILVSLRNLANRTGRLDSKQLSVKMEDAAGVAGNLSGMLGWISSQMSGQKIILSYRCQLRGAAGRFFSQGLLIEETVYCKTDSWKNPEQRLLRMLSL
jgi:hypothetical protein